MDHCRLIAALLLLAGTLCGADEAFRWYKGNTHTHTFWSDGNDFPESVADWYKRNGYSFLVLSDHNILSRGEKWKTLRADQAARAIPKNERRWGRGHVETRVHEGQKQVRLRSLREVRGLLEEPGRFIMIEGVEITSTASDLPVHSNPMNISGPLEAGEKSERTVEEELALHERAVLSHETAHGRPVFWQVNHPNFKYALTGEQLAEVEHLHGIEFMNASSKCFNLGDELRPSVERIWDIVNTLRLKRDGLPPVYGTATDDTHDYHQNSPAVNGPGSAWVMTRSQALTPDAITAAMRRGDFYASTGVLLKNLHYDAQKGILIVEVDPQPGARYEIEFIGTPVDVSLDCELQADVSDENGVSHPVTAAYADGRIGMTLQRTAGARAVYRFTGEELYVRAVIHSDEPPHFVYDDGSDFNRKGWTQPFGWKLGAP